MRDQQPWVLTHEASRAPINDTTRRCSRIKSFRSGEWCAHTIYKRGVEYNVKPARERPGGGLSLVAQDVETRTSIIVL